MTNLECTFSPGVHLVLLSEVFRDEREKNPTKVLGGTTMLYWGFLEVETVSGERSEK